MEVEGEQIHSPTLYHFKQVFHSVGKIFLLKWHDTCSLQKFARHWCALLKGRSKTQLLFLTKAKLTSGQWHKTETAPIPSPGIPALCFNDPCHAGNQNHQKGAAGQADKVTHPEWGGWRAPLSIPKEKGSTEPVAHWMNDFPSGICSLGCISHTAALTHAEVNQKII